jgi:hypothetical protein
VPGDNRLLTRAARWRGWFGSHGVWFQFTMCNGPIQARDVGQ